MAKQVDIKAFHNVIEQVLLAKGYELQYTEHQGDDKAIIGVSVRDSQGEKKLKKIIKRVVKLLGKDFEFDLNEEVEYTTPNGRRVTVHNVHSCNPFNYRFYNY